jgi:hypothetical protein
VEARQVILKPADIVLVHGRGWLSDAIRKLTRSTGEEKSWASHVGLATGDRYIVEALVRGVVAREMPYGQRSAQVWRPRNLSKTDKRIITRHALDYVGEKYGWGKAVLHGLDGALGGVYLFRRLAFVDAWPICSWIVASSYAKAGYTFGVDVGAASPDDIWDFVHSRADKYERVG